jgi:hypothetical protein
MARSVSGGAPPPSRAPEDHFNSLRRNDLQDPPLSVGASTPPPARNKGPGSSLPGPDASHPLQAVSSHGGNNDRAVNVQLAKVTKGQSRLLPVSRVSSAAASAAMICPIPKLTVLRKPTFQAAGHPRRRFGLGSHAGSHTDEQPRDAPDPRGQPGGTGPRSRTDLNGSGCPHMELRIRCQSKQAHYAGGHRSSAGDRRTLSITEPRAVDRSTPSRFRTWTASGALGETAGTTPSGKAPIIATSISPVHR